MVTHGATIQNYLKIKRNTYTFLFLMSIKLEYLGVLNQINLQNRFALKYQNDYFVFAHLLGDSRDLHGRFARALGPVRPWVGPGRAWLNRGPAQKKPVEPGSGPRKYQMYSYFPLVIEIISPTFAILC